MEAPPTATADDADSIPRAARRVCIGCGTAVVVLSVVVLAGWVFGIKALKEVAPGLPAMTSDTAIGLGCAGLALALLAPGSRRRSIGRCLGGVVAMIGLLVIFEYLVAPIGIDQLLFRDSGSLDPGRPSPHTAVALVALGSAFVTSDLRRLPVWVHQGCLALSGAVAVSALTGYIYDVDYLRGVSGTNGMAVHTLAGVITLTIGALALHPDRGLLGMMHGEGGGAIVARVVIPLGCGGPLAIGAALFVMQQDGVIGVRLAMSLYTLLMVALMVVMLLIVADRARRADARGREVSNRLQAMFDHVPAAISLRGLDGRYLDVNEEAAAILGRTVEELIGNAPEELTIAASLHADDREMHRSRKPVSHKQTIPHADGDSRSYQVIRYPVLDHDDEVLAFGTFAFDITEQNRTIVALELAQEQFRSMFEEAPIGMAVISFDGRLEQVNDALCRILGYPREALEGIESASLMHQDDLQTSLAVRQALLDGDAHSHTIESRYRHAAGHSVAVDVHLTVLRGGDGGVVHFLAQVQDITERKRDHAHLTHLADHDPLTGVRNRRSFERMLAQHTRHQRRRGSSGALLVIDLDQFKQINDTLGHQAGDEHIVHTVRSLERQLRTTDVIARLGGDEFAVLLPETSMVDAVRVGRNLLDALRVDSRLVGSASASIGVASLDDHSDAGAQEILRRADQAMYAAKSLGGDRVSAWDPAMLTPVAEMKR
jgi:diguanylate cyclase (GGDEF)-like protein/PAS domain S-box-containing protein